MRDVSFLLRQGSVVFFLTVCSHWSFCLVLPCQKVLSISCMGVNAPLFIPKRIAILQKGYILFTWNSFASFCPYFAPPGLHCGIDPRFGSAGQFSTFHL
jgi:hypothetical protein